MTNYNNSLSLFGALKEAFTSFCLSSNDILDLVQEKEPSNVEHSDTLLAARSVGCQSEIVTALACSEGREPIRNFRIPKDRLPFVFRLMRVQGLPAWANSSSVAIDDVIQVRS